MVRNIFFLIILLFGIFTLIASGGGGGEDDPDEPSNPSGNTAPTAEDISISVDLNASYIELQLMGIDADNDTLIYALDAPVEGEGYEQAFVESDTGRFFITLLEENNNISLSYRVSDGSLFSEEAEIFIQVLTDIEDSGLGALAVDPEEYGEIPLIFYDDTLYGATPDSVEAPSSIDLSNNFPIPGNQGQQGSCVGWATAYALKSYQERIEEGWSFTSATIFSPAWIYNQINRGVDQGSHIHEALQLMIDRGAATLQTMPYNQYDYITQPNSAAIGEAQAYKAISYSRVNGIQQIKAALANRQPIIIGIDIYENFNYLSGSNSVYNSISGNNPGGHAVTIVGYDDNRFGGAFRVINSWGTSWGDQGYFWLPYDFVDDINMYAYVLTDGVNSGDDDDIPEPPISDNLPNLQIVDWNVTYNAQPGGSGSWTWEVVNAGIAVAESGADVNLMLSRDTQIDSSDIFVVYEEIPQDLAPGESIGRTEGNARYFNFPETLAAGTYYMVVWVDDLSEIAESNEQDNQSFGSNSVDISLPGLPDLAIEYWWASWYEASGDGILEYTIINNGVAPTTSTAWDINLILSQYPNPLDGAYYYLFYEDGAYILQPGDVVYRSEGNEAGFNLFRTQSGMVIPTGIYYMSLWIDDFGQEEEANEINNLSVGNNLISISNYSASSSQLNVNSTFNAKRIPEDALIRQIKITENPDGSKSFSLLPISEQMLGQSEQSHTKVIKSYDKAVFPRTNRYSMPEAQEIMIYAK